MYVRNFVAPKKFMEEFGSRRSIKKCERDRTSWLSCYQNIPISCTAWWQNVVPFLVSSHNASGYALWLRLFSVLLAKITYARLSSGEKTRSARGATMPNCVHDEIVFMLVWALSHWFEDITVEALRQNVERFNEFDSLDKTESYHTKVHFWQTLCTITRCTIS